MKDRTKVLVVGQTPPPIGGQAMMIKYMLDGNYEKLEFYHVRMHFSRDFNERGRFSLYKLIHLVEVIVKAWITRFRKHTTVLYYPISSSPRVALLRDVVILLFIRCLFKKTVFHFHAAGVSEEIPKYNWLFRIIIVCILKKPDLSITSSDHNPKDGEFLKAKRVAIIPLGIPDDNTNKERTTYNTDKPLKVLFVGLMNSSKGEGYLLDAWRLLAQKGISVEVWLAGRFESKEYEKELCNWIEKNGLTNSVKYWGVVSGKEKKELYLGADVFCFPSFFPSESFGIVLLEAMMYQMPLIASRWRGVQSVVSEGENGFLVNIRRSDQIAHVIEKLHKERNLLITMGKKSRTMFEDKYRIERYLKEIEGNISMI